jgi:hypothetical protein
MNNYPIATILGGGGFIGRFSMHYSNKECLFKRLFKNASSSRSN